MVAERFVIKKLLKNNDIIKSANADMSNLTYYEYT